MTPTPLEALQAAQRHVPPVTAQRPALVIAGAAGVLGSELLTRLAGAQRHAPVQVLVREPFTAGLREVATVQVPTELHQSPPWLDGWQRAELPALQADVGVVVFDVPRLYHDRERALWMPLPAQLPALAQWLRGCGVHTLAVVLPHAPGRLPEALKRGLASLDEQAVAALGFERLLIVRTARKPALPEQAVHPLARVAQWMLSVFGYMVPQSEQPVRASKVAEFVTTALQGLPPGIHIAAPETVWRAMQGPLAAVVRHWLQGGDADTAPRPAPAPRR